MTLNLILLTPPSMSGQLTRFFAQFNKIETIKRADSLEDLAALISQGGMTSRLVSFGTDLIVPADLLEGLAYGAYNFHPGPPTHPGWAPASFALYDGAEIFGATLHEMTAKVDAGSIVGTELFAIAPHITPDRLAGEATLAVGRLMRRLGRNLATQRTPLTRLPIGWSDNYGTRAKFARMREISPELDQEEKARRVRAFGTAEFIYTVTRRAAAR